MAEYAYMLSNEELVSRFQEGNDSAFVMLAERMMPMLRFEADRMICSHADSDDFVQEAMLGLLIATRRYRPDRGASFATFSRICVKNRLLNAAKALTTPESPQEDSRLFDALERREGCLTESFEDRFDDREEDAALLERLKEGLSAMEYRVLICHLSAYTYDEIARLLDMSPKSVDNAMQRIRRKLFPRFS